MKVDKDKVES